jgi:hypothetical protein
LSGRKGNAIKLSYTPDSIKIFFSPEIFLTTWYRIVKNPFLILPSLITENLHSNRKKFGDSPVKARMSLYSRNGEGISTERCCQWPEGLWNAQAGEEAGSSSTAGILPLRK